MPAAHRNKRVGMMAVRQARLRRVWAADAVRNGGATVLCALAAICIAQGYPTKPIRIVNTVAAGGPAELIARLVGEKLTEAWGLAALRIWVASS